ncbi:hypothetical protein [Aureimonas psammosilenae]|uniref:hypothetical protein n=1 Tax=Aureimonas psammosilenae TaxID=2495496 RepID=UPI001260985B|nr:hypothetical protein [Aureimonas psammosilenae]
MKRAVLLLALLMSAAPAQADPAHETGFAAALRGCEAWALQPASWNDGPGPFLAAIGLGNRVTSLAKVPPSALPPPELRRGLKHWKVPVSPKAGFVLTVSDALPICHVVGQGEGDFASSIEAVIASPEFAARWEKLEDLPSPSGVSSTSFRSREEPKFTLTLSRRLDVPPETRAVKVIATAIYDPGS